MIPLIDFFKSINEPKYRAQQLLKWIHQKGVTNFDLMTDFNKPLREKLKSLATLELPKVSKVFKSPEGTEKYLVELASGSMIEMVVIPEKKKNNSLHFISSWMRSSMYILCNRRTRI